MSEELLNLSLDDEEQNKENNSSDSKNKYKDRKIDHKLTKYEAIIKNVENINRVSTDSEVNFPCLYPVFFKTLKYLL